MRLISFDVGIKNLAYCVFSIDNTNLQQKWSITEWNCANLIASEPTIKIPCCHPIKGKRKNDLPHPCNKSSKWILPNGVEAYCELHAKVHTEWIIPKKQHTPSQINKLKLGELERIYATIQQNNHPLSNKMKKQELAEIIIEYYETNCFKSTTENVIKSKNAGEIDLVTIGRAIRRQLDGDSSLEGITHVIIENQISTIAARMKTIQGMIAQYFIMRFGDNVHIEFVSSHNKLKGFTPFRIEDAKSVENSSHITAHKRTREEGEQNAETDKKNYKANKSDGINICREFFNKNPEMGEWSDNFEKSKKRDDLADCFLQGIWYLKSNKIIYYADDLKVNSILIS
jgi:hypothetical protein